jgi:hypothetical protein
MFLLIIGTCVSWCGCDALGNQDFHIRHIAERHFESHNWREKLDINEINYRLL